PYGLSAIDTRKGKVLWRYKGADKGITNLLMPGPGRFAVADRDDLICVDAQTGKRVLRVSHKIERASFGLLNDRGDIVIGGQSEIAAFDLVDGRQLWRARHTPPGRGIFRTVAAIAARAASLYFRFNGPVMTARSAYLNLQGLATISTRTRRTPRFKQFG